MALFSDEFLSINRGVISSPPAAESYKRFNSYFNNVVFIKWDDVNPPVVRFSDDASMAYAAIDKLVITQPRDDQSAIDTTHFAWLTVYKKIDGQWKIDCVTSTNKD